VNSVYQTEINEVFNNFLRALRRSDFGDALKAIERIPESERRDGLCAVEHNRTNRSFALIEAARFGATELIVPLVNYGADLEGTDDKGSTPLMRALLDGHVATAEALIKAGASTQAKNKRGTRVADCALRAEGGLDLAKQLFGKDVPLQQVNRHAESPLHFAAISGDIAAIDWVLSNTAFTAIDRSDADVRPLDRCSTLAAFALLHAKVPDAPPCVTLKSGNTTLHLVA
jgi:uncharacterized protein